MSVVKYLVEKLRAALHCSPQRYSDKELKGGEGDDEKDCEAGLRAMVSLFSWAQSSRERTRRSLSELKKEGTPCPGGTDRESALQSCLFAYRSSIVSQFPLADRRLWEEEGVTEELMSDEEDSQSEPGVWVARSPRFRSPRLSELIQRINSSSKPGLKQRRKYGPESDRLPSREGLKGRGGGEGEGEGEGDLINGPEKLFAYRSSIVSQFPLADRRLWEEEGVTEELMSDEEDSQSEPGVWVARSPRFRSPCLSELIQRINSSSKPGLKQRRKYGPESDRLPSREGLKGRGGGEGEGEGEGEGDIYSDRLTLTAGRNQGPGMIIIGENGQYCEETEVKREGED
ncbi:UNVERIFIED_CONTAM: hypothetical protein FKN15_067076 [Acipenser sinensis]